MRVVLTRPLDAGQSWRHGLESAGHAVEDWPLIDIRAVDSPEAVARVQALWAELLESQLHAVMFVSRSAVQGFFVHQPAQAVWPASCQAWATGPGTRQSLLAAGVDSALIRTPAQNAVLWDSESLWAQVGPQVSPGWVVGIVRGMDAIDQPAGQGRDWLAQQLTQAGASVRLVASYQRQLPQWSPQQRARAVEMLCDASVAWVLSSSQALHHWVALMQPDWADLIARQQATIIATHERIAHAARAGGLRKVHVCKPDPQAVAALLASLESSA